MGLTLASRSPQRRRILEQLGIDFEIVEVDVEERVAGEPVEVARGNALRKAEAGAAARPGSTVLGVDTIVVLDGEIFGKPDSEADAEATLKRLSGRSHEVISGLALLVPGNPQVVHEVTNVTFRSLPEELICLYVKTGEWQGRAGGYAIQEQGAALVRAISGDYLNVVGLPLGALLDLDLSLILR
ncbi:MAG TPA: Maf family protein [Solirubrobacteraceae bacterium]|nr:Maf family protein [Solirubrobacteraceae bacterium]